MISRQNGSKVFLFGFERGWLSHRRTGDHYGNFFVIILDSHLWISIRTYVGGSYCTGCFGRYVIPRNTRGTKLSYNLDFSEYFQKVRHFDAFMHQPWTSFTKEKLTRKLLLLLFPGQTSTVATMAGCEWHSYSSVGNYLCTGYNRSRAKQK